MNKWYVHYAAVCMFTINFQTITTFSIYFFFLWNCCFIASFCSFHIQKTHAYAIGTLLQIIKAEKYGDRNIYIFFSFLNYYWLNVQIVSFLVTFPSLPHPLWFECLVSIETGFLKLKVYWSVMKIEKKWFLFERKKHRIYIQKHKRSTLLIFQFKSFFFLQFDVSQFLFCFYCFRLERRIRLHWTFPTLKMFN